MALVVQSVCGGLGLLLAISFKPRGTIELRFITMALYCAVVTLLRISFRNLFAVFLFSQSRLRWVNTFDDLCGKRFANEFAYESKTERVNSCLSEELNRFRIGFKHFNKFNKFNETDRNM